MLKKISRAKVVSGFTTEWLHDKHVVCFYTVMYDKADIWINYLYFSEFHY